MSKRPAIVLFAYSEVGSVCLEELIKDGANVAAVYTHEDDPNEEIWFRSVRNIADENNITVRMPSKITESDVEEIRSFSPELIFSFYYRAMIPKEVLDIPRLGSYNIHGALLPKYRGRACVNWAVINGESKTGATLHVMTEFADKGAIAAQKSVPILFEDTAHDVFLKIAEVSRQIIKEQLPSLEAGRAILTEQDESQATKFGRRRPEDGRIDWNKSAVEIYNLARGVTHPFPGAFAEIEGKKTFIWKARPIEGRAVPGEIVTRKPLTIGTKEGLIEILRLQPEGEPERDA